MLEQILEMWIQFKQQVYNLQASQLDLENQEQHKFWRFNLFHFTLETKVSAYKVQPWLLPKQICQLDYCMLLILKEFQDLSTILLRRSL